MGQQLVVPEASMRLNNETRWLTLDSVDDARLSHRQSVHKGST